jgi:hypothetical protein
MDLRVELVNCLMQIGAYHSAATQLNHLVDMLRLACSLRRLPTSGYGSGADVTNPQGPDML